MSILLYAHPFSSYCQKALIALYENDIAFEWRLLTFDDEQVGAEFAALWPLRKMPVLVERDRTVVETTIIIEYLGIHHPGPVRLIPESAEAALDVRLMDRIFDNYVMTPMQRIVGDFIRSPDERDPRGVKDARQLLENAYGWLDNRMAGREWATAAGFTLADCAAAPALFYADWVHPIATTFDSLRSYRQRLLARPSFARAVDEARPYRELVPPGAPDRD